jgi:hypothetical protein
MPSSWINPQLNDPDKYSSLYHHAECDQTGCRIRAGLISVIEI